MKSLYDSIGTGYDFNRRADSRILNRIVDLLELPKDSSVLDVACGTGNYTVKLHENGYKLTGIDISDVMLEKAKRKNGSINWVKSSVEKMPFNTGSFDGAICTLACHHFEDLDVAFKEIYRVLHSGGKFILFTCFHIQVRNYWLYKYFPKTLELMTTYMPDFNIILKGLSEAGFIVKSYYPFYIDENLQDNFLGARFEKPELYLSTEFRSGMSIFASKANQDVVMLECANLKQDLDDGSFVEYIRNYKNYYGDYVFVTAEKI